MDGLDSSKDRVEVWELTRLQFGINLLPIHDDLERAATRGHQAQRFDALLESQKFFRQTDGPRLVVSSGAILDYDLNAHRSLSCLRLSADRRSHTGHLRIEYPSRAFGGDLPCGLGQLSVFLAVQVEGFSTRGDVLERFRLSVCQGARAS